MGEGNRADVLRRAIDACVNGETGAFAELFTDDVSAWSPTTLARSRDELADALAEQEAAFSDVAIEIDALDVFGNKAVAEFRVTARFTEPFVVDDAVLEPTGRSIVLGAALVAEFDGDRICAFRNYFDETTLLEQMLVPA